MAAVAGSFALAGVQSNIQQIAGLPLAIFGTIPTVTGAGASVARTLKLAKNGVVAESFIVRLRVTRADWFKAVDVAHVRPAEGTGGAAAVIDFGIPRTVSAISATEAGIRVESANRWLGASFDVASVLGREDGLLGGARSLNAEVRTERLQVVFSGASSFASIRDKIAVKLPEIPGDLELRVDGATPVWTSPGTVAPGEVSAQAPPLKLVPGRTLNGGTRWLEASATELVQDLDMGDVLNALLGDPMAPLDDEREITVVLSSRIPGAIGMETPTDPSSKLHHRARVTHDFVDDRRELRFATEGTQSIALEMPPWSTAVHAASCTIAATCDAKRTLPPDGPDSAFLPPDRAPNGASNVPTAELVLDAERSIAFPLHNDAGMESLFAVRVPLRVAKSGCELRAVLLGPDAVDPTAPGAPLDGGAGKPTSLEPGVEGREQWVTLDFPSAVLLAPDVQVFVALHFIRGAATMAATHGVGTTRIPSSGVTEVWRGPPAGPWEVLPDGAGLSGLRGRLRLTGTAASAAPIAPLRVALAAAPTVANGVTPSPKGVPVEIAAAALLPGNVDLRIAALTPCTVSVRDVIVTVSR